MKQAEELAQREAEEKRRKEMQELGEKRRIEEKRLQEEQERIARESAEKEAELKRKAEEAALYQTLKVTYMVSMFSPTNFFPILLSVNAHFLFVEMI